MTEVGPTERRKAATYFQNKYIPEPNSGCWLWIGPITSGGYGIFSYEGKRTLAHRASWEFNRNKIPGGLVACHKCDVPCCVNPDHLFIGPQKDNVLDCKAKGRLKGGAKRGEKNPISALTEKMVIYIRSSKKTYIELANEMDLSLSTIIRAGNGRNWSHLPNAKPILMKFWEADDTNKLLDLISKNTSTREISYIIGKSVDSVQKKIKRLGAI